MNEIEKQRKIREFHEMHGDPDAAALGTADGKMDRAKMKKKFAILNQMPRVIIIATLAALAYFTFAK